MPRSNSCGIVFASLDVENGREHGALEDGDERGEVGVDLRVVLEVVGPHHNLALLIPKSHASVPVPTLGLHLVERTQSYADADFR